uniref:Uncharacterized protein n=1 Tax=Solanum lycopersicum TaxID=4081 RepID=A0A3Q7IEP1_SOLLC
MWKHLQVVKTQDFLHFPCLNCPYVVVARKSNFRFQDSSSAIQKVYHKFLNIQFIVFVGQLDFLVYKSSSAFRHAYQPFSIQYFEFP